MTDASRTGSQLDLVLLALLRAGPAHGYALIEEMRARTDGMLDVPEGTVYPALYRLERDGVLESSEVQVNGRRRRVYRLTSRGSRALDDRMRAWDALVSAVNQVLAGGNAHGSA